MSAVPVTERVIAMTTTRMLQLIRRPAEREAPSTALQRAYNAARDHDWRRMLPVVGVLGVVASLTSIPIMVLFDPPVRPESALIDLGLAAAFGVSFRTVRGLPDRRLPWLYAAVCWLGLAAAGISSMLGGALTALAATMIVMLPVAVALFAHWTARSQALWCMTSLIALAVVGSMPWFTNRTASLDWAETLAAFAYSSAFSVVGMAVLERARRTAARREVDLAAARRTAQEAQAALEISERRYREIVQTAAEGIWVGDTEWRTTFVNDHFCQMTGWDRETVIGTPARDFVHPDDLRSMWGHVVRQEGTTTVGDFRVRPRGGQDLWVTATASPLLSADGTTHGYLAMLTDISARRTMEDRLRQLNETLRGMVDRDGLTGVLNRRALERVLNDPPLHQRGVGVLLVDADRFKDFNDTRGHQAGDDALRRLAALLGADLRDRDRVFRYGGEEFLILLDDVNAASALAAAERLRSRVETAGAPERDGAARRLPTISVGVALGGLDEPGALSQLIEAADMALYAAKAAGRNCVTAAAPAAHPRLAPIMSPTPSLAVAANLSRHATLGP